MEIANHKEFKELIKRYEDISLTEIRHARNKCLTEGQENFHGIWVLNKITGFGKRTICSLCHRQPDGMGITLEVSCDDCIYSVITGRTCDAGENYATFRKLVKAQDEFELQQAIKDRATHMRIILRKYNTMKYREKKKNNTQS